jgi:hypothetical protein
MTARKDNRMTAKVDSFGTEYIHTWQIWDGSNMVADGRFYGRRRDARRGMERFLRRIGADPARVRWEGER